MLFQRNSNSNNSLGQTAFSATNHRPKCYGIGANGHIKKHCRQNQLHNQTYSSYGQLQLDNYYLPHRRFENQREYRSYRVIEARGQGFLNGCLNEDVYLYIHQRCRYWN